MSEYVCSICDLLLDEIPVDWREISVYAKHRIYRTPSGRIHCLQSTNLGRAGNSSELDEGEEEDGINI
jgi:hypothetical protein